MCVRLGGGPFTNLVPVGEEAVHSGHGMWPLCVFPLSPEHWLACRSGPSRRWLSGLEIMHEVGRALQHSDATLGSSAPPLFPTVNVP